MWTEAMLMTPAQIAPYLWQYVIFIGSILSLWALSLKSSKNNWACMGLFLLMLFLAGFRQHLHTHDTWVYVRTYEIVASGFLYTASYMEPGYLWYNYLLSLISPNPQLLLFTNALLTLLGYYICYRRYSLNPYLTLTLFAVNSISGFVPMMNLARQFLSIAIIMVSVTFIVKRNLILFLLCVIVAANFHTSAYFALPLYFLYPLPFKAKYAMPTLIAGILLAATPLLDWVMILMQKTAMARFLLLHVEGVKIAAITHTGIAFAMFVFCWQTYRKYKEKLTFPISPSFLLWTSLLTLCVFILSIRSHAFDRIALLFSALNILALSNFICLHKQPYRSFLSVGAITFFIIYSAICFVYRPEWGMPLPFRFCF